jgi:antirestriction protein ArdC
LVAVKNASAAASRSTIDVCGVFGASYKQWQELGGQVRKGERASLIVFFKLCDRPHHLKYVTLANM